MSNEVKSWRPVPGAELVVLASAYDSLRAKHDALLAERDAAAEKVAAAFVKELFELGSDTEVDSCNRIQFMCGKYPGNERPMGGMNRAAMERFALRVANAALKEPK